MRSTLCLILISISLCSQSLSAGENLHEQSVATLKKSTSYFRSISTNGGYVGIYSLDLKKRYGEAVYERAKPTEIWVQPPGTPTVGQCYLAAWKATDDRFYLDAARDVARALVWGQRQVGGWDHRVDVSHLTPEAQYPKRKKGRCTFDDKITQGAIEFLIETDSVIDEKWLDDAIELAMAFMLQSQCENGAWTQWYPLRGGYHDYYTFNDNSINDCISVMLKAHRTYGKPEYLQSAKRGGDFLIDSQLPAPQAGWAQQYDHKMKPAWARSFEPPGVCSAATVRNIRTLTELYLYTHDPKFLQPVPPAIKWLDESKIDDNLWARLYEISSNRPVYGDRTDGNKVHYDYDKVSEKERTSYAWRGEYGTASTIRNYRRIASMSPEALKKETHKTLSIKDPKRLARNMEPAVQKTIASLDEKGRWTTGDTITSQTFTTNATVLTNYIKLSKTD